MKRINLIENQDYILKNTLKYKNFSKNIKEIFPIQKLSDYKFEGNRFKLIEYQLLTKSGKRSKIYGYTCTKKCRKFQNQWNFLNYLYSNNFSTQPYLVPKPIILFAKANLFLREKGEGKTIFNYIKQKKIKNLKAAIIGASGWLLKFHNLEIKNRKIFIPIFKIEEKEFNHYLKVAKKFFLKKTQKSIKKLLFLIHKRSKSIKKEEESLIHGDFQPTNIIYNKNKGVINVVDFDWGGLGDCLSDVGNFLIQFDYHSTSVLAEKEIIDLKNEFLNHYFKKRSLSQFAKGINLYQAKFAIQRAIFISEFTLPRTIRPEKNLTIKCLLKKAKECCLETKKINLKLYPYES